MGVPPSLGLLALVNIVGINQKDTPFFIILSTYTQYFALPQKVDAGILNLPPIRLEMLHDKYFAWKNHPPGYHVVRSDIPLFLLLR
jgi:hypothetical protein